MMVSYLIIWLSYNRVFLFVLLGFFYEEGSSTRLTDPPLSWIRTRVKSLYPTLYSYAFYSSKKKIQREYYLNNEIEKKLKKGTGCLLSVWRKRDEMATTWTSQQFVEVLFEFKTVKGEVNRYFYHENVGFSSEKSVQAEDLRSEWKNKVWFILRE